MTEVSYYGSASRGMGLSLYKTSLEEKLKKNPRNLKLKKEIAEINKKIKKNDDSVHPMINCAYCDESNFLSIETMKNKKNEFLKKLKEFPGNNKIKQKLSRINKNLKTAFEKKPFMECVKCGEPHSIEWKTK